MNTFRQVRLGKMIEGIFFSSRHEVIKSVFFSLSLKIFELTISESRISFFFFFHRKRYLTSEYLSSD